MKIYWLLPKISAVDLGSIWVKSSSFDMRLTRICILVLPLIAWSSFLTYLIFHFSICIIDVVLIRMNV